MHKNSPTMWKFSHIKTQRVYSCKSTQKNHGTSIIWSVIFKTRCCSSIMVHWALFIVISFYLMRCLVSLQSGSAIYRWIYSKLKMSHVQWLFLLSSLCSGSVSQQLGHSSMAGSESNHRWLLFVQCRQENTLDCYIEFFTKLCCPLINFQFHI